jgi:hypothetical protein
MNIIGTVSIKPWQGTLKPALKCDIIGIMEQRIEKKWAHLRQRKQNSF